MQFKNLLFSSYSFIPQAYYDSRSLKLQYPKLPIIAPLLLIISPHPPIPFIGSSTSKKQKKKIHPPPLPPPACIEKNSTSYEVWKLKKAIKFKKYFGQRCYVAWCETLFLDRFVISPTPPPNISPLPWFISPPKTPYEVV